MPLLNEVVAGLETIAPLELAAEWDNVGLLIEPAPRPEGPPNIERVLLTIDLSEPVLDEALEERVQLVVAYHPPVFKGLKRLTAASLEGRIALRAVDARVAVYSPHTALDAVVGGVNDWLADALGPGTRRPIEPTPGAGDGAGMGRSVELAELTSLGDAVANIKRHLSLDRVRVAQAPRHLAGARLATAAVCAGAGGSLLSGLRDVDLVLTGEMRHHDVQQLVAGGTSVVLCDHTNTERGYLPRLVAALQAQWPSLGVIISARDRDPLRIT
jgi:dinuclear metal center YbgI/SA1388 family protein